MAERTFKLLTLLFVRRPGQVLLGMKKRGFGAGRYNGFGGKVEPGETVLEGARRELNEEASVDSDNLTEIGRLYFEFKGDPKILQVHVYSTSSFTGTPTESEEMAPAWFDEDSVPFQTMWPDDKYWFGQMLADKSFSGYFLFEGHDIILGHILSEGLKDMSELCTAPEQLLPPLP